MTIKIKNQEEKTYIVMGSPNSATSFISKCLNNNGVKMGNMYKDFYEDYDFSNLNKLIIRNGNIYKDKIQELIKRKKSKFWGWKDPRTAFTIEEYLPHLDNDVYLICCFRKPAKILKSWKGRYSKELIDSYNRAIIKAVKRFCILK